MARTLKDAIEDDVDVIFLNSSEFAMNVTRYPAGVVANAVSVTAVFVTLPPVLEDNYGKGERIVHRGTLDISSGSSVGRTDQWLIQGLLYQTEYVRDAEGGMRTVGVRRDEKITTSGADAGRIR